MAPKIKLLPPILGEIIEENIEQKQAELNSFHEMNKSRDLFKFIWLKYKLLKGINNLSLKSIMQSLVLMAATNPLYLGPRMEPPMNSQLVDNAGTPALNTYIDDLQTQPLTLGPGNYWNIAPLNYKLIRPTPDGHSYSSDNYGVDSLKKRSANKDLDRPFWEHLLLGAGTIAVIVILYDGVTGAGIINL